MTKFDPAEHYSPEWFREKLKLYGLLAVLGSLSLLFVLALFFSALNVSRNMSLVFSGVFLIVLNTFFFLRLWYQHRNAMQLHKVYDSEVSMTEALEVSESETAVVFEAFEEQVEEVEEVESIDIEPR